MGYRFWAGFLLCWLGTHLFGQPHQTGIPPIHNYTKQDYRAETQNWAVAEDQRGLVYFGNNLGLLEYDGTHWQCFPLPNRSIVRSINADSMGRIWVGGQDELGYFEANPLGQLVYHSLVEQIPDAFRNFEDIWGIFFTEEGIFWQTKKYLFLQKESSFSVFESEIRFDRLFSVRGDLYLTESGKGIQVWREGQFHALPWGDFFAEREVTGVLPLGKDGLLVATLEEGVFKIAHDEITPWPLQIQQHLAENRIYCVQSLANGQIAVGTSHMGLLILDQNGTPLRSLSRQTGLLNNSILSLKEDRHHNLWLGLENGLSYIEISSPFSWINAQLGVDGSAYSSIIHDGKLFLATNQGVFQQNWSNPPSPLFPHRFNLIANTKGPSWSLNLVGNELIAGKHLGAGRIQNSRFQPISPVQGSWKLMQLESDPTYAVEGTYAGLCLYHKPAGQTSWTFLTRLEGFEESSRVMEQDPEGNLWISHPYRGVFRVKLDLPNRKIQAVKTFSNEEGLPGILSINVARIQDQMLFTTERGIFIYEPEQNRFVPHEAFNRLFGEDQAIYRLIEDENGTIWFSTATEFGILKIEDNTVEKTVRKLPFNRLQNRLVKGFEHIYAYDQAHTFIGTDEGFIVYNSEKDLNPQSKLLLYIREVTLFNGKDSLIFGGSFAENGRLLHAQPAAQIPSLEPSDHNVRLRYSAPFFGEINEIQYQYILEGYDQTWSPWTEKTEKEYTNLEPGEYHFQVKARNIYRVESEPAVYTFIIEPHWYQTHLARFCFVSLGLTLLIGIFWVNSVRLRIRTEELIQGQEKVLEQKEAEYMMEAQKTEAELIRLRNEKLQAEINHKNKELASSTMHLVQKGEILVKIKQNLEKIDTEANSMLRKELKQIVRMINDDIRLDKNWEQFELHFDQVHEQFLQNLREKHPVLTPKDQRLCAYLRMNLSTKEIAQLMNISVRGVEISRYRLRKKLALPREINLNDFMMGM